MTKLDIAKRIITDNIKKAECGIFDTRNNIGDPMSTLYNENGLQVDICYRYEYFEVFGLTDKEFNKLEKYYDRMTGWGK